MNSLPPRNMMVPARCREHIEGSRTPPAVGGGIGVAVGACIGRIEFQMPQKTHEKSCREAAYLLLWAAGLASKSAGGT